MFLKYSAQSRFVRKASQFMCIWNGAKKVGESAAAASAAVSAATGLTVAATSGAGITSGLAAAGSVVGGGMAMGPAVLAGGPAYIATQALNCTVFRNEVGLSPAEARARAAARTA